MSRMQNTPEKTNGTVNLGRRATLKDVAERAGVTPAMVSFTLSGKRRASQHTLEAITRAAQELGYVPNPHAQRLAVGRCEKTISLVWAIDKGVAYEQSSFIQHRLDEAGFTVDIHGIPTHVSQLPAKHAQMVSTICHQKPRAIICRITELEESALLHLKRYVREGGIVVGYGRSDNDTFDRVAFDRALNIYRATAHLLDLGHRKIGLSIQSALDPDDTAVAGFKMALAERNVELREEWLWSNCCYEEAGACLAEKFLQLKERPTAICIINDVTASTFVSHLYRAGLRVPHDVSVVGYDDMPAARYALVPLTTVSHPVEGIARPIIEMLMSRLDGSYDGAPRCISVDGELIVRESTAPPPN